VSHFSLVAELMLSVTSFVLVQVSSLSTSSLSSEDSSGGVATASGHSDLTCPYFLHRKQRVGWPW